MPELVNQALRLARIGGRVNIFAGLAGKGWAEVEANVIHDKQLVVTYKQLVVTGSSGLRRSDDETALALITSERVDTASLVTHRFPLQAVDDAFAAAAGCEAVKWPCCPRPPMPQTLNETPERVGYPMHAVGRHGGLWRSAEPAEGSPSCSRSPKARARQSRL